MQNAAVLHEVEFRENGASIHVTAEPIKLDGLLDASGHIVEKRKTGLMVKLDAKAGEKVELSKGTLWLIGTVFVLAQVAFNYGGSILGWTRDDQSQKLEIQQLRSDVTDIKATLQAIQSAQTAKAIKDAEERGFKLGVTASEEKK